METPIAPPPLRDTAGVTDGRPPLPAEAPLLPPVLGGSAAFIWLWILPIAVLLLLNVQGYWLVEGNMNEAQRSRALWLGVSGAANLFIGVALFAVTRILSARVSPLAQLVLRSAPALLVQVGYLWFATTSADAILPASVTAWIYPSSRFFFNQFSFAMLPLFFGILQVACAPSGPRLGRAIALNLAIAIGGPCLLYVFAHGIRLFSDAHRLSVVVLAAGMIVLGVTMFVGLVRALMLGLRSAQKCGPGVERMAIVGFALLMPLAGLVLNRAIPFPVDFQAWEVYALVVVNAAILLAASVCHDRSPRLSFCLLCATLPFSLYFFIVFLPYTPLSIIAVILLGVGFLVLTPTVLFALHLHLLNQARHALGSGPDRPRVFAAGTLCLLILPAFFAGRAAADRAALNAALAHLYTPAITPGDITYPRSVTDLRRALRSHRDYKNGIYYPIISDFYAWFVFNHLVLPDDKLAQLEQTFLGAVGTRHNLDPLRSTRAGRSGDGVRERSRMPRARPPSREVEVADLATQARAAGDENSVVTFALSLRNRGPAAAEYRTTLPLPPGIVVSGFRLHINGTAVPGRIFEKKTALWVYTMIRDSERRDPGLLFYNTPEELELCVFPIAGHGAATVEIDFLVPGSPATSGLARDPAAALATLGTRVPPQMTRHRRGSVVAGSLAARGLPVVEREPYLHLIVDRSLDHAYTGDLAEAVSALRAKFPAAQRARVTLANYDVFDFHPELTPLDALAKVPGQQLQRALPSAGGFALDLALAHAIRRHRDLDLDRAGAGGALPPRPIFIVLSGASSARTFALKLAEDWVDVLPRLEVHELNSQRTWTTHRSHGAAATPLLRLGNSLRPLTPGRPVRFAAANESSPLEFWSPATSDWRPVDAVVTQPNTTPWSRAVALQLQQQDYARSPGDAELDLKGLVAASRSAGILLAGTSYIVVENSAQWRMLERSEHQKLGQNEALAFLETPAPPALYVILGFGAWLAITRRRTAGLGRCRN